MAGATFKTDYSLQPFNTFGIAAKASFFASISNITDLTQLLATPTLINAPKLILGGGSNILLTQDFHGLVIKNNIRGIHKLREDEQYVWLQVGAGETWHDLVEYTIAHQYAGLENLSLIPGSVGAAPIQNIGAYGVELKSVFDSLEFYHFDDQKTHCFTATECQFGYRNSIFKNTLKNQGCILSVTLRLNKQAQFQLDYGQIQSQLQSMGITTPTLRAVSDAVVHIRQSKLPDPKKLPNAGSFFKNPVVTDTIYQSLKDNHPNIPAFEQPNHQHKLSAAWLIQAAGLKGYRADGVGVSPNHALVLVNYSAREGHYIQKLASKIQSEVYQKFKVELVPEVNII